MAEVNADKDENLQFTDSQRNSKPFFDAFDQFKDREKLIPYFSQSKLHARSYLPIILAGKLPGIKHKWIEFQQGKWHFHDKFFMLFDSRELSSVRNKIAQITPIQIRPTEEELNTRIQYTEESDKWDRRKRSQKLEQMLSNIQQKVEQKNPQRKIQIFVKDPTKKQKLIIEDIKKIQEKNKDRVRKQKKIKQNIENNENQLMGLVETWLGDISKIMAAVRQDEISVSKIKRLGFEGSIIEIRNQYKQEE